jgi:NAD(P)-dependent dehydrogenase (short-subunit alcohol dehydrogenase family)
VRNRSIYGLAKSSVETLTEQLAVELGPEITVNAVAPGQIEESLIEMAGIDPVWAEEVVRRTPLRRLVTRGEVAQMVAMLCSSTFDGVTGVTIAIDGGLRLSPA